MLYNRDENDDEGLLADWWADTPAGAQLPAPLRTVVWHCLSEPREHGGIPISNSTNGWSCLFWVPLPLFFENPTCISPPFMNPSCSDVVGWGRNAKENRNSFQSTIFLHFSNYKVSMTYKWSINWSMDYSNSNIYGINPYFIKQTQ